MVYNNPMDNHTNDSLPRDFNELPPARRRRIRRGLQYASSNERRLFLQVLQRATTPGIDFLLFSALGGVILGLATLLDAPVVFILGIVTAPFLSPVLGMALASAMPAWEGFLRGLTRLAISLGVVFIFGLLSGWLSKIWAPSGFAHVQHFKASGWADWITLTLGAVICALLLVRSENKPLVPGVIFSYEILLPISAAGFCLAAGIPGWWVGVWLAFVRLFFAVFVAGITFFAIGLTAQRAKGVILLLLPGLVVLALFGIKSLVNPPQGDAAGLPAATLEPVPPPEATTTPTVKIAPTETPEKNTQIATATATATRTLIMRFSPTFETPQPASTPTWATVKALDGAVVRAEPRVGADVVAYVYDGNRLQMTDEIVVVDQVRWVKVITPEGVEGWMMRYLLILDETESTPAAP